MKVLKLRQDDLVWREVGGEVVVLDLQRSVYASLNTSGRRLWLRLADGATLDELVEELRSSYDLPVATAHADAEAFVGAMHAQGLLA